MSKKDTKTVEDKTDVVQEEGILEEETTEDEAPLEVDYEAIATAESERAEAEKAARLKAEKALAEKAFKDRQARREDEEDDEDKPLTRRDMLNILAENNRSQTLETKREQISQIATEISNSEAEARAIIVTFQNRSFPADLSLREQLAEAKAIVNSRQAGAREAELRRALNSKERVSKDAAGTHRDAIEGAPAPKIASSTQSVLQQSGFKWDPNQRLYTKKLPNGKMLFANPKAGPGQRKQWIA